MALTGQRGEDIASLSLRNTDPRAWTQVSEDARGLRNPEEAATTFTTYSRITSLGCEHYAVGKKTTLFFWCRFRDDSKKTGPPQALTTQKTHVVRGTRQTCEAYRITAAHLTKCRSMAVSSILRGHGLEGRIDHLQNISCCGSWS